MRFTIMAKVFFVDSASSPRSKGVIVGSMFKVDKVKGYSLKFKSKVRGEKNELVDMTGKKLMEIMYGDGFLCVPNRNKRPDKRDPDFVVFAYPDAKPYQK